MRRSSAVVVAAMIFCALALWAPSAGAAPDNDDFADAVELVGQPTEVGSWVATATGSNVDATDEPGEPFPPVANRGSVWWSWVAPSSIGSLTVSTAESTFDTVVSVWTGDGLDDLTLVGWSDDIDFLGEVLTSEVTVAIDEGVRYFVAVSGYDYASRGEATPRSGEIELTLTWNPVEYVSATVEPGSPAAMSADGRYVTFATTEPLVEADENGLIDVYRLDTNTATPVLVSVGDEGAAMGASESPSISADGSMIAFSSSAPDLVAGDDNDQVDVFVRDLDAGETRLVSRSINGGPGSGGSLGPSLSADGTLVAFESFAPDLVRDDTNGTSDVFLHDLTAVETTLVSVDLGGGSAEAPSDGATISADGTHVVFESAATDLTDDDVDAERDVYLRDLAEQTTQRIDSGGGDEAGWISADADVSADGRFVVTESRPSDDANAQILLHDLETDTTTIIWADGEDPSISDDGRIVALSGRDADGMPSGVIVSDAVLGQTVSLRDVMRADLVPTGLVTLAGDGRTYAVVDRADAESGRLAIAERGVPEVVTGVTATAGDASVTLSWDPTTGDEIEITAAPAIRAEDVVVDGTNATVSGLENGETYRFEVRALTAAGAGPADAATALPSTTPGPVTLTDLASDDTTIEVSWAPPDDGGLPLSEYQVEVTPDVGRRSLDGERFELSDLEPGTEVEIVIAAVNANGAGPTTSTQRLVAAPSPVGYHLVAADGTLQGFGDVPDLDDVGIPSTATVVAAASVPLTDGILVLSSDAVVRAEGVAPTLATNQRFELAPGEAVVDLLVADASRAWVITSTGRVLTIGRAVSYGDASTTALSAPIVGADLAPDGEGYHLVAADGGVFSYGSATFAGSLEPDDLSGAVVDLLADPDGQGYWIVADDGGVFALDAPFAGSAVGAALASPVVGAAAIDGAYVLVGEDGGVFNYTAGPFLGGLAGETDDPIAAIAPVLAR
ncbi:MAG: fibronectin type III domain-containing protein [Actinomycetota bacterium]